MALQVRLNARIREYEIVLVLLVGHCDSLTRMDRIIFTRGSPLKSRVHGAFAGEDAVALMLVGEKILW